VEATTKMVSSNITNLCQEESDIDLKRWQEISAELSCFLSSAVPGDIFREKRYMPYAPRAPQQFRNTPLNEATPLKNGTTVIEIGFVDFGITFDSCESIDPGKDPVVVVGYEAEPLCVAKSLAMLEMMKDTEVRPRSVNEVWLSSLWSEETVAKFKKATGALLGQTDLDPKVRRIVKYWNGLKEISREAALDFQFKGLFREMETSFAMQACCLSAVSDRVEYLRYHLTKALYEDHTTTRGSLVMCVENESIGVKQMFESCIQATPSRVHYTWQKGTGEQSESSLMGRTRDYFDRNMQIYMSRIRSGTLKFTPKLGTVSIPNDKLCECIKEMNPYIISWSNVVDYVEPVSFHILAKRMSGSDTAHYLH